MKIEEIDELMNVYNKFLKKINIKPDKSIVFTDRKRVKFEKEEKNFDDVVFSINNIINPYNLLWKEKYNIFKVILYTLNGEGIIILKSIDIYLLKDNELFRVILLDNGAWIYSIESDKMYLIEKKDVWKLIKIKY